jgi:hypothetical protein
MPSYKFKVGDTVVINPAISRFVPGGVFEVTKRLPGDGEHEYRIKRQRTARARRTRKRTYQGVARAHRSCIRNCICRDSRSMPRRDFSACEPALWPAGTFARAYAANRRAAIESIIEADPIATCLRTIMADRICTRKVPVMTSRRVETERSRVDYAGRNVPPELGH